MLVPNILIFTKQKVKKKVHLMNLFYWSILMYLRLYYLWDCYFQKTKGTGLTFQVLQSQLNKQVLCEWYFRNSWNRFFADFSCVLILILFVNLNQKNCSERHLWFLRLGCFVILWSILIRFLFLYCCKYSLISLNKEHSAYI